MESLKITPDTGLTHAEAAARKARGLANTQPPGITKPTYLIWSEHIFTFFNAINIIIAASLIFVGSYANLTFMGVVISNLFIGVTQEIRSKKTVEKLSLIYARKVSVLREGEKTELPREELVLGDIISLKLGDQIPTDSILIDGSVEADESLLTGESLWIKKGVGDYLLSGSAVTSGACRARVERVGGKNYATALAIEAQKPLRIVSKLMRSLRLIVRYAGGAVVPLGALMFMQAYAGLGHSLQSSVEQTAASVIGMIPSGLILLTSMTLAVGVMTLSKRHMLVQEPYSIETLARADILCLDKTGTLTTGDMSVTGLRCFSIEPDEARARLGDFVCSLPADNPTSKALRSKFFRQDAKQARSISHFSSEKKYSAAMFDDKCVYIGAPEMLCPSGLNEEKKQEILTLAQEGYRIMLLALSEPAGGEPPAPAEKEPEPAAFILLRDEIRPEAEDVLNFFKQEGVSIKLISGDNPLTVVQIARRLKLDGCEDYVDLSALDGTDAIVDAAKKYTVFGRVAPHEKKIIVKALQKEGHTVAMTGDGVNDLLALREADCSIALQTGSPAARQASHMVMLTDDFSALPKVVMEGRRVVNNITRMASLFLVKSSYSFLLTVSALLISMPYPFQPIQLSFISALTVGIPSFFLAMGSNKSRITGNFLKNVLSRALPAGICVYIYAVISGLLGPRYGLNYQEVNTLCVYLTGAAEICVLLRVCLPLDKWRAILWFTMTCLFFTSVLLFYDLLDIIIPDSAVMGIMFCVMAGTCYPLLNLLSRAVGMLMFMNRHPKGQKIN